MRSEVDAARLRIASLVTETRCVLSSELSRRTEAEVFLKLENLQESGSFKLRGVANRLLSLGPDERATLLVAASTGNHGAAFAHVVRSEGLSGKLFLPRGASVKKLQAIEAYGVPYELVGSDCIEAELHARAVASGENAIFVPPYNDHRVVAGQGTVAAELLDQLGRIDTLLAPVGGGGLIGGIGAYLDEVAPEVEIIGCQPAASSVMCDSIRAGRIVEIVSAPTLSDATAGGIEQGSITFDLCRRHVDDFEILGESEIADAIRFTYEHEGMVVEGAAALPIAAALRRGTRLRGQRVALVVTGAKIDDDLLRSVLA